MADCDESTGAAQDAQKNGVRCWYAAYTRSRHEKCVAAQLELRSVEYFLPLYKTIHRWKNGKHRLQLPLFPGYVFVHVAPAERLRVLQVPGLVYVISLHGIWAPISDHEISSLQHLLKDGLPAEPHPYLTIGSRVRIVHGPLTGLIGILLREERQCRIVVSIDRIMQSIVVNVDAESVMPIDSGKPYPPTYIHHDAGLPGIAPAKHPVISASLNLA